MMSDQAKILSCLQAFLKQDWPDGEVISVNNIAETLGGWSKRMYSVDITVKHEDRYTDIPLILRINAPDNSAILRNSRNLEHILLRRLKQHTSLPVPNSYLVDSSARYFDAEAMLLERLPGNPRITSIPKDQLNSVAMHLVELMAQLHTTPLAVLNHDGVLSDPNGWNIETDTWDKYIDTSCSAWKERYGDIAFDTLPIIYDSFHWLQKNKPRPLPLVVVHGELNPNNLLVESGRVAGMIDWERPHVGDPREDLAWFRYFEQAMAGTSLVSSITQEGGYLGYYNKLTGFDVTEEELDYFTIFSHADVSYGPYSSMMRGLAGEHDEVTSVYFLPEPIIAQGIYPKVLGYRANQNVTTGV
jgi:aminoglycoside phosphotransferase (APT) family kinase protein